MEAEDEEEGLECHLWRTKPSFYTWENDGPEKVSGGSGVTQLEMHSEPSSADSQPRDPPTLTVPSPWWQRTEAGRHLNTLEGPRRERVPGLEESRRRVGSEAVKAPVESRHPSMKRLALHGASRCHLPSLWSRSRVEERGWKPVVSCYRHWW